MNKRTQLKFWLLKQKPSRMYYEDGVCSVLTCRRFATVTGQCSKHPVKYGWAYFHKIPMEVIYVDKQKKT